MDYTNLVELFKLILKNLLDVLEIYYNFFLHLEHLHILTGSRKPNFASESMVEPMRSKVSDEMFVLPFHTFPFVGSHGTGNKEDLVKFHFYFLSFVLKASVGNSNWQKRRVSLDTSTFLKKETLTELDCSRFFVVRSSHMTRIPYVAIESTLRSHKLVAVARGKYWSTQCIQHCLPAFFHD